MPTSPARSLARRGRVTRIGAGEIIRGDLLDALPALPSGGYQLVVADPPYFRVLRGEAWDNRWRDAEAYLAWTVEWVTACARVLAPDGLLYIFGQPGKREHVFLHACSALCRILQFHDLIVWDRAVGYNERRDSFTPQYELILALRHPGCAAPYFDKDAVRIPYGEETIRAYLRDRRYKDRAARAAHLARGKFATNLFRVPSLKGASREKAGHPSQKPLALIERLVLSGSRPGDRVLDPFLGSGTTAVCAQRHGRRFTGIEIDAGYAATARRRVAAELARDADGPAGRA